LHKLGALSLAVFVLGLQLRATLGPWEDWPFTSAPMFAFPHAASEPLYEIAIVEVREDLSEHRLRAADLGLRELSFGRYFFGEVYGSTDPRHPAGHHPSDTPARFAQRMGEFSARVASIRERRGQRLVALRYELVRLDASGTKTSSPIGRFEVRSRIFASAS
jgi:hypothetical protein